MKRLGTALLGLVTITSLAWVATPVFLIRPFRPQTPEDVALSYAMRGLGPRLTLILLALAIVVALPLWRATRSRTGRALVGSAVAALAGLTLLARANHFEWMFRPLPRPEFARADESEGVAEDDLVLGVRSGTESRAYPVRALAYHHLVNDLIAGEPIVATY